MSLLIILIVLLLGGGGGYYGYSRWGNSGGIGFVEHGNPAAQDSTSRLQTEEN